MELTSDQLPWFTEDEAKWNDFLRTETGKRLLPKLAETTPELLDGSDVNKALVRSGEVRGMKNVLWTLLALSHSAPLPTPTATEYPSLTNDAAWQDGEKLDPEQPKK